MCVCMQFPPLILVNLYQLLLTKEDVNNDTACYSFYNQAHTDKINKKLSYCRDSTRCRRCWF